jgi:tetratricopeptide (TPR) repeat protein
MRQAFLIAARDELGLATRDMVLREESPEKSDSHCLPFELFCGVTPAKKEVELEYRLSRAGSNDPPMWRWKQDVDPEDPGAFAVLTEKAEAFSRGELKGVLTRAGFGANTLAPAASAEVPAPAADLLWSWNEVSVLAGLRRVHSEIRRKGESPQLLAALVVGYANLGSLTEHYYCAAHKAFFARSLLYAERLVRKTNASAWGLCHRAYARTLAGLHKLAVQDIAAAKARQAAGAAVDAAKPLPSWTEVLDAFAAGDLARMLKGARASRDARLARYLNIQAVVYGDLSDVTIEIVGNFLKECPDFARGYDILATCGQLGPGHEGAYTGLVRTGVFLRKRLLDVFGLPAATARQIDASPADFHLAAEIAFRNAIVTSLKAAGAPALDRGEPSLSCLGHLVEEIDFAQVMRRLEFDKHMYALPTNQLVEELEPFCSSHPCARYLAAFQQKIEVKEQAARELSSKVDLTSLTFTHRKMLQWLNSVTRSSRVQDWLDVPARHRDAVFGDLMRDIESGLAGRPESPKSARYMSALSKVSDKLPVVVALRVTRDWPSVERETGAIERNQRDDPFVMTALANRFYDLKRYDHAERCAKRLVEMHPSYPSYRLLASVYKAKNDMARWKETLDRAIELPSYGLEQAQLQNQIAKDLMKRKQLQEAAAYADAAAESYSRWSMDTSARCHEMLGDWKKSETLVRAISERYDNGMMTWLKWCVRTGHGDLQTAIEFTRSKYEEKGTNLYRTQYRNIGHFYLLTDEPEKAFLLYQRAYEKGHDPFEGFHAALTADSLGKADIRDRLFQEIIEFRPRRAGARMELFKQLAEQFQQILPSKGAKRLDLAAIDKLVAYHPPAPGAQNASTMQPSVLPYFVGAFLKNRGDLKAAQIYLIRCAQLDDWEQINHVLACKLLREMKVKIPPPDEPAKAPSAPAHPN